MFDNGDCDCDCEDESLKKVSSRPSSITQLVALSDFDLDFQNHFLIKKKDEPLKVLADDEEGGRDIQGRCQDIGVESLVTVESKEEPLPATPTADETLEDLGKAKSKKNEPKPDPLSLPLSRPITPSPAIKVASLIEKFNKAAWKSGVTTSSPPSVIFNTPRIPHCTKPLATWQGKQGEASSSKGTNKSLGTLGTANTNAYSSRIKANSKSSTSSSKRQIGSSKDKMRLNTATPLNDDAQKKPSRPQSAAPPRLPFGFGPLRGSKPSDTCPANRRPMTACCVDMSSMSRNKNINFGRSSLGSVEPMKRTLTPTSPMDPAYVPIQQFLEKSQFRRPSSSSSSMSSSPSSETAVLKICEQRSPIPLSTVVNGLEKIMKVGEGVFGEVFVGSFVFKPSSARVYKIVPIEGSQKVNGERQKTFEEILPEILISKELSKLHTQGLRGCRTDGFVKMHNVRIAKGRYPSILVETWKQWDKRYTSDNDIPDFSSSQLFVIFEFDFAGKDAEEYVFRNARQAFFLVLQIAHILAVGESALEFEHRDLHWGNILVQKADSRVVTYRFKDGRELTVPSTGIKACIIDFTIARIVNEDKVPVFLDLKEDEEQFLGTGDYQFDIYRIMKDCNRNEWSSFCPKTNNFWVRYLADKLLEKGRYFESRSAEHNFFRKQLCQVRDAIVHFDSCSAFVKHKYCEDLKNLEPPTTASKRKDIATVTSKGNV